MENTKTKVAFKGTASQESQLRQMIEEQKHERGALMPIMQQAQAIYGYLPIEVQTIIAEGLGIPMQEVYGTATFYSQFNLNPKGKFQVSVCLGTACYVKGAGDVFAAFVRELGIENGECTEDNLFSLDSCRCIGACGLAPVMMVNDDVYGNVTPAAVPSILEKYRE